MFPFNQSIGTVVKMLKRMRWIGLTGGIASGKSTVAGLFKGRGIPVVDADQIAKQVVGPGTPGLKSVIDYFGSELLLPNGELDRKALGRVVFNDHQNLKVLEQILHPLVQAEVLLQKKCAADTGAQFAIYDVPLLFEKNLQSQFDGIISVVCSLETQRLRMKVRDGLTDSEIDSRLSAQVPMSVKVQSSQWVIQNDQDLNELKQKFESVLLQIQSSKT